MVLWGPPGSGKTTLARVIASLTQSHFEPVSAVSSGVADLRRGGRATAGRARGGGRSPPPPPPPTKSGASPPPLPLSLSKDFAFPPTPRPLPSKSPTRPSPP